MSILRIPDRLKSALRQVSSLSDETMESIVAALSSMKPALYDGKAAQRLGPNIVGMSSDEDFIKLLDAVISLYMAKSSGSRTASEIAGDVLESLNDVRPASSESLGVDEDIFRQRIIRLLSIDAVEVCAKATALQAEYPRLLTSARVITDIRPVFARNLDSNPTALIVHNLKIEYLEGGEITDIFLALDESDLDILIKTLERAKLKQAALESFLDAKGLPLITD